MAITKKAKTSVSGDIGKRELCSWLVGCILVNSMEVPQKKKRKKRERELPYVLAILLLGIHPRKQKH